MTEEVGCSRKNARFNEDGWNLVPRDKGRRPSGYSLGQDLILEEVIERYIPLYCTIIIIHFKLRMSGTLTVEHVLECLRTHEKNSKPNRQGRSDG